jgi:hypothetical protein
MKYFYFLLMGILCLSKAVAQPVSVTTLNVPYTQDFNTLANTSASNVLPAGWFILETGTGAAANGSYIFGVGTSTAGDTYSFGLAGSTERALGTIRSGTVIPRVGFAFTNQSGSTITALQIAYQGEQWRLGALRGQPDRLDFQISYNATSLSTGDWTDIDALDFTSPNFTGPVGALNGNLAAYSLALAHEITGLSLANGQTVFIRWLDIDVPSSDDGLAVDDFSITPIGQSVEPNIAFSTAAVAFGDVNAGAEKTMSYEVIGSNLGTDITVTSNNPLFQLSTDNNLFSSSVNLAITGGTVYVRFSPTSNGAQSADLSHASANYSKDISVTGFGFVQSENIIPIATARQKSSGTKVTVAGRVTVANEHGNPAFIQDDTGGIPVFDAALANGVQIGDSVIVTGPIGLFNEQKQISGSGIFFTKIETAPRVLLPKVIALSDLAANEGLLVKILDVELVNKSFVFYPQSTERITDGTAFADLRIDGDTDIPGLAKPQAQFEVTGVVGRFRANAQLLPRFQPDIPAAAEPTTPTDGISRELTFDVVNWNFEFFGARSEDYGNDEYGPADEALQLANIKQVLQSLNADVIAVQEVSDEQYFASLVEQLGNYDYVCSPRFSYSFQGPSSDFPPQKLCFIYDNTTVQVESARPMFEALYDEARSTNPSVLPSYPTGDPASFWSSGRLPFLVNVKATIQGVAEKVSFVVLHAKSGSTIGDLNRRAYDAQVLKDTLDAHFSTSQVIILGDLNDDLDASIVSGQPSSYLNFVNDLSYNTITKSLSEAGARSTVSFQDVIDHQIITTELNEEYLEGSATIIAPFRQIENYAGTTSDHLPVITRYRFVAPIAGFAASNLTVSEGAGSVEVVVNLSKPLADNKIFSISLSGDAVNGQDFSTALGSSNTLSLPVDAGETSASFTININDDGLDENAEAVAFALEPMTGVIIGTASASVTITDNDVPSVSFTQQYVQVLEGGSALVTVKLSTPAVSDQVISISSTRDRKVEYGVDYTTNPSGANDVITLGIPAGANEASFTFDALGDKKKEAIELVTFRIASASEGLTIASPIASVVGIENVKRKSIFMIYPNPTNDLSELVAVNVDADEMFTVEIREPNGRLLVTATATLAQLNDKIAQSLVGKRKGLYTLSIVSEDETMIIRIVKL